jgi:hypothetical protein
MSKGYVLSAVLAAVLGGSAANAAVVTTFLSVTGSANGDARVLNDGVIPANFSAYNAPDKVNWTAAQTPVFRFDMTAYIDGMLINADNNDDYKVEIFNGVQLLKTIDITAGEGVVTFGVETFMRDFAPMIASHAILTASGGDGLYGVGELQFFGNERGVPEPATWAMMISGFALAGAAARRRATARMLAA